MFCRERLRLLGSFSATDSAALGVTNAFLSRDRLEQCRLGRWPLGAKSELAREQLPAKARALRLPHRRIAESGTKRT